MGFVTDLKGSSRLGLLVAASAATVGVIYGYDQSNIAGALLPLTTEFHLSTHDQELVTTAVVIGQIVGRARRAERWPTGSGARRRCCWWRSGSGCSRCCPASRSRCRRCSRHGCCWASRSASRSSWRRCSSPSPRPPRCGVRCWCSTRWRRSSGSSRATSSRGRSRMRAAGGCCSGLAAVPAALVVLMLLRLPDTARWYMLRGRTAEARRVLADLDPEPTRTSSWPRSPRPCPRSAAAACEELLRMPWRRATVFVVVLGFFIQITGINAIVYYSPRIFESMGFSGNAALLGLPGAGAGVRPGRGAHLARHRRPLRPQAHPAHRHRDHGGGERAADRRVPALLLVRRRADRARFRRAGAVHRRVHVRLRLPGVGVRGRVLPGPAACARRERDADRRPGGQRDRRRRLPHDAERPGRRGHVRGVRGAGPGRDGVRAPEGAGDEGQAPRGDPAVLGERRQVGQRRERRARVWTSAGRPPVPCARRTAGAWRSPARAAPTSARSASTRRAASSTPCWPGCGPTTSPRSAPGPRAPTPRRRGPHWPSCWRSGSRGPRSRSCTTPG